MSNTAFSEQKLKALDTEVRDIFSQLDSRSHGGGDESRERIDRILRRVRLEARIQEESDAARESDE